MDKLEKRIETLARVIENLQIEIARRKKELEEKEENTYYYIDYEGYVCQAEWQDEVWDDNLEYIGNVFGSYKEAEDAAEKLAVHRQLKDLGARPYYTLQENWGLVLINSSTGGGVMAYLANTPNLNVISAGLYFDTEDKAVHAIQEIGNDRLRKYYFDRKDD